MSAIAVSPPASTNTRSMVINELTSVLRDVTAAQALTPEVATAASTKINSLFKPVFELDKSGSRSTLGAPGVVVEGMSMATQTLDQASSNSGQYPDVGLVIDGIASALKGAHELS